MFVNCSEMGEADFWASRRAASRDKLLGKAVGVHVTMVVFPTVAPIIVRSGFDPSRTTRSGGRALV